MKTLKRMYRKHENCVSESVDNLKSNKRNKYVSFVKITSLFIGGFLTVGTGIAFGFGAAIVAATGVKVGFFAAPVISAVGFIVGAVAGIVASKALHDGLIIAKDGVTNESKPPLEKAAKFMGGLSLVVPAVALFLGGEYVVHQGKKLLEEHIDEQVQKNLTLKESPSIKYEASKKFECKDGKELVIINQDKNSIECECLKP